jgi:hypothetical protein
MALVRTATVCLAVAAACGPSQDSEVVAGEALPGYVHALARSRFPVGAITGVKDIAGMREIVGSQGVFATEDRSQMVLALPNEGAPSLGDGNFPGGGDAQNAAVLDYFVNAGLPRDQVLGVAALEGGRSFISANSPGLTQDILSTNFDSYISRGYRGVEVVESFAWSQLGSHGESISESVYWPEIPASIMSGIAPFQSMLADAATRDAYLGRLPDGTQGGVLAIHHTSGTWQGAFAAALSFDVSLNGVTVHFDANGSGFTLPGE